MPESDLDLLVGAAREAGRIALGFFRKDYRVWDKGGAEGPVTEADHAVNERLEALLRKARPDYGWLSEETPDDLSRLAAERVFILDPIDGTRAFIEGSPDFAHSVAVAENGRVTAAVVFLPARDRLYAASASGPALCNDLPIRPSGRAAVAGARVLAPKSILSPDLWTHGHVPAMDRSLRPSLASRLCLVADGSFDAALTLRPAWEWDIAAGACICERAGLRVTDRLGSPIAFNRPNPQADGVIAAGEVLWDSLRASLA